jgi:dsDNA-specific endonuclease/ATPase MutS2
MTQKTGKPPTEKKSAAVEKESLPRRAAGAVAAYEAPAVQLPLEDSIDLHPFAPRDVRSVVDGYLEEAAKAGYTEVRLIHGRGVGSQREAVRTVCARHPRVATYADATPESGGWGATIAHLRRA